MNDETPNAKVISVTDSKIQLDLVVVLGMHRSGTSAITRGLQALDVELGGNLMPPDRTTNVKGFWEDLDVYQLNLELLSHLNLDWHSVSPISEVHADVLCESGYLIKAVTLLRSKITPGRKFGLKDPRIAKLIIFWQRVFRHCDLKVGYVVALRNPISVAQSLNKRDGFDFEKSYLLWLDYTLNSLVYTEKSNRVVVDFSLLLQNPSEQIERIAEFLNLSVNYKSLTEYESEFLDSSLCHSVHRPDDLKIDNRIITLVAQVYLVADELASVGIEGGVSSDRISRLRSDSRDISPIFRYVDRLNRLSTEREEKLVTLCQKVAENEFEVKTLNQVKTDYDVQFAALRHAEVEQNEQLLMLRQTVAHQDKQLANLRHAIAKCDEMKMEAEARITEAEVALNSEKTIRIEEALAKEKLVRHTIKHSVTSKMAAMFPVLFLRRAKTRREVRHMKRGSKFDRNFYESQLPVGFKIHQPAVHYVVVGKKLGLKPHPKMPPKPKEPVDSELNVEKQSTQVVFFSGEPHTPGHCYRVVMYAEAASLNGHGVRTIGPSDIVDALPHFAGVDVLVIWRAAWDENIAAMVSAARCAGARIVFDVDDLMFDPSLAKLELIDGIRTQGLNEADIAAFYGRMGQTMQASDFYTCSTQPLATAMRRFHKPTMVLPNGFDKDRFQRSRKAVEVRRTECQDGRIRLGYAGGSKTHQRDFAQAVSSVARILHENPKCLLVLFRAESATGHIPYITTEEFPELHGLDEQIEWRNLVPVHKLPDELARFDINLAPLETGNPYCEAKSELKYFEAALVGVPTVASPTGPYAAAIRHEETGFLASTETEWYQALSRLVHEPDFRKKMAEQAFMDVVWKYGPERRTEMGRMMLHQVVGSPQDAANSFALELRRKYVATPVAVEVSEYDVVVEYGIRGRSDVAVIVPLYNYARFVGEALESVATQTLSNKDLIVVDDCSTDNSLIVAKEWIELNHRSFTSVILLKNRVNFGLALTRNAGFAFSDAPFVMPLDADNMLGSDCLARCLEEITETGAATAYPTIEMFGDATGILGSNTWQPARFAAGNCVDAMAMIRKSAWASVGGYRRMQVMGWEDFELWCRFIENGLWGILVPDAQAHYRVHGSSMIRNVKESNDRRIQMMEEILEMHPWLDGSFLAEQWQ